MFTPLYIFFKPYDESAKKKVKQCRDVSDDRSVFLFFTVLCSLLDGRAVVVVVFGFASAQSDPRLYQYNSL